MFPIILGSNLVFIGTSVVFAMLWATLRDRRRTLESELKRVDTELNGLREKYKGVVDAEAERERILSDCRARHAKFEEVGQSAVAQITNLKSRIAELSAEFNTLDEEANLQSFGLYRHRFDYEDSERFQKKLEEICDYQKQMIKDRTAAVGDVEWTVNGDKKEGRKQINQTLKLMLRAFNGECDAAVSRVRAKNVSVMEARINKGFETINGLAQVQQCRITREYLNLKLQELYLAHEYQLKVQDEKEEQRRIREQMRQEEIAQREFERARQQAEDEEQRYAMALEKARAEVEQSVGTKHDKLLEQIGALEQKLAEAHNNKERAISRAQMTRSGHVYIISNIGSFGEHVYKIGMTRRLDPMDRIWELGDASVPFDFDVHAVIFSEDAPAMENALHRAFHDHRVNLINERKEFFNVTIDDIILEVRRHNGDVLVTKAAAAEHYRQTVSVRQSRRMEARIAS